MDNSGNRAIYFALADAPVSGAPCPDASSGPSAGAPCLVPGFGFTAEGRWRGARLPRAEALALDDRYPPAPAGLREAVEALRGWEGLIVCDFERAPDPLLRRLLAALAGRDAAVPPAYADAPHSRVLIGPYRPGRSFARWIAAQKARYGAVILDGAPIRHRAAPGRPAQRCLAPLPEEGSFCPGALCLCRRQPDGTVIYWDSRQTLAARCGQAGAPAIVFRADWDALPER